MTTPSTTVHPDRVPLRLRIGPRPGHDVLDGGWWPQSRDLAVELADLVDHFPHEVGRPVRVGYAEPDWDRPPRRVAHAGGTLEVAPLAGEERSLVRLTLADDRILTLLVVPPAFTAAQGDEALLAAATPGNSDPAAVVLATVAAGTEVDPDSYWTDRGDAWWGPNPVPPSSRLAPGPA